MVGTAELVCLASARSPRGTVPLVAAIETVIMPVAAPAPGHTALVGTREGVGRACVICQGPERKNYQLYFEYTHFSNA